VAKARGSVTVDRVLPRRCDRIIRGASRSQVFEKALERWLRDSQKQSLEQEIERYYSSMRQEEQAEASAWASLASRSLGEIWK
jgi:metal-responsive CopG/Arc/MetJ family transcriptional regulator